MGHTIQIITEITADDYTDSLEVSYPCSYSFDGQIHRLKYTDDEAGFTVFKILPDGGIEIRRRNSFTIFYRKGVPHSVSYESEFGTIPMTFTLLDAEHSLTEEGGSIRFSARVTVDGEPQINKTTMRLTLNERNDNSHD